MPSEISAKVGNAQIIRLGHTESNQYGNNPTTAKNVGRTGPRDLKAK